MTVYTIGYRAGWNAGTIAYWIEHMHGILVDIRLVPVSRHPEWRADALRTRLGNRYHHLPALGNQNYQHRDRPIVLAAPERGIDQLRNLLRQTTDMVLLCACAEVATCHRAVVASLIPQMDPTVPVVHLAPNDAMAAIMQHSPADPHMQQLSLFAIPAAGEYPVPMPLKVEACRSCGAPVSWTTSPQGHAIPLSLRQARMIHQQWYAPSHFRDCPDASQWSSRRKRHAVS